MVTTRANPTAETTKGRLDGVALRPRVVWFVETCGQTKAAEAHANRVARHDSKNVSSVRMDFDHEMNEDAVWRNTALLKSI